MSAVNPFIYSIQRRIHEWAEITFGSAILFRPLFKRVESEMTELRVEAGFLREDASLIKMQQEPLLIKRVAGECADVVITLFRLAGALGFDLLEEVEKKQDVNERRKWRSFGDGTGQHIKNTDT